MNKRYVFSVYKLTIGTSGNVETTYFITFKEAKTYAKLYKERHADAQIISVKEEKVHSKSSQDQLNV